MVGRARFQEAARAQRAIAVDGQFGPESVRALQVLLTRKGLNPGKIDGIFGTKAKRAFQEFLRGCGYVVGKIDGFFGPRSVMALQSWVNMALCLLDPRDRLGRGEGQRFRIWQFVTFSGFDREERTSEEQATSSKNKQARKKELEDGRVGWVGRWGAALPPKW